DYRDAKLNAFEDRQLRVITQLAKRQHYANGLSEQLREAHASCVRENVDVDVGMPLSELLELRGPIFPVIITYRRVEADLWISRCKCVKGGQANVHTVVE